MVHWGVFFGVGRWYRVKSQMVGKSMHLGRVQNEHVQLIYVVAMIDLLRGIGNGILLADFQNLM